MRVTLVSHASVIVESGGVVLWTDPWLFGRAFNESWALSPAPRLEQIEAWLPRITHLYVSHEHPDHFHIPTLRWLPSELKQRVTVLFQRLHTDKMPTALRRLGFETIRTVRHREQVELASGVRFYLYQVAPLDSACAVLDGERVLLNLNDCEPSRFDRRWLRQDLGAVDVLLNQFSIATYDGRREVASVAGRHAARVLDRMVLDHRGVEARRSVPFASFMYFCQQDNAYLNHYRNSIRDVQDRFEKEHLGLVLLRPFETYDTDRPHANDPALDYYRALEAQALEVDALDAASPGAIEVAAARLLEDLKRQYPRALLWLIGRLRIWVPDIQRRYVLDFRSGRLVPDEGAAAEWDLQVNSQPLLFALQQPFGFQTLSISGRFRIQSHLRRFLILRVVMALRNSEIFLRPRHVLTPALVAHVRSNFPTLFTQFLSKIRLIYRFVS